MAEGSSGCHRLCHSAVDLSVAEEDFAMFDAPIKMRPDAASSAGHQVESAAHKSSNQRSSTAESPKHRAFLTPPLMRKRLRLHDSTSTNSLAAGITKGKSLGIIGLLKAKFDRTSRAKGAATMATPAAVSGSSQLDADGHRAHDPAATTFCTTPSTGTSCETPGRPVDEPTRTGHVVQSLESVEVDTPAASDTLISDEQPATKRTTERQDSIRSTSHPPEESVQSAIVAAASFAISSGSVVMPRFGTGKHSSSDHKHVTIQHNSEAGGSQRSLSSGGPYKLHILLKQGRELAAKDACGTSDPYVKFKLGNKVVHRSKTIYRDLHPVWDEDFTVNVEDATVPLQIRVFDYDWGIQDDFLGAANFDLTSLELNKAKEATVALHCSDGDETQGYIDFRATLSPKNVEDEADHRNQQGRYYDQVRKLKVQIWSSVVNILVIEGKQLAHKDGEPLNKPYLRLRLGNEKYKTKSVTWSLTCSSVTWLEQFDFHLFEDQSHLLEIFLCDKESRGREDFIGKAVLDLTNLEGELTHSLTCDFQDGAFGSVSLLVTISGTTASETISDLTSVHPSKKEIQTIVNRYAFFRTLHNLRDVGHLTVKVYRATGLASADIGGKSDPFCVLQLVNSRLQTQTEYKTLNPTWNKIFTFNVKDINAVLEATVYDEDRDHRVEFLGKVAIPLLRVRNGQRRWYALKDRKLHARAKGNNPQILLELNVVWNEVRAAIQTLVPKENKYIEPEIKFNRHTFVRNVMRVKSVIVDVIEFGKYIESCWEWESKFRSTVAFVMFMVTTWYFEPFVLPLILLLYFLRNFLMRKNPASSSLDSDSNVTESLEASGKLKTFKGKIRSFTSNLVNEYDSDGSAEDEDDEADDKNKEERKSLKEKLQTIQEVTLTVQNSIGHLASLLESIKNTFNFSVPFLSYLAIVLLTAACLLLYLMPLRYLILGWGINKFTRKLLRPHSIPNNEVLDFLSRVPDDEQLAQHRELRLEPVVHAKKK